MEAWDVFSQGAFLLHQFCWSLLKYKLVTELQQLKLQSVTILILLFLALPGIPCLC